MVDKQQIPFLLVETLKANVKYGVTCDVSVLPYSPAREEGREDSCLINFVANSMHN
jgi:hypothetical protein